MRIGMGQAMTNTQQDPNNSVSTLLFDQELDQVNKYYEMILDFFANYSFQLIGALIIFVIGYVVAGKIAKVVLRLCERNKLDVTLSQFLSNTTKMLIVIMVVIIALGKLGVSVTPFIAAIGAASLGAGLALQGLLANYASGFNIIMLRPFVVGDTITVQGVTGVVNQVLLAYTIIRDENDVEIMIPNKHIVGEVLHNSKQESLLQVTVGIAYKHNPNDVVELLESAISEMDFVSKNKKPVVGIDEFADSSINIAVRFWAPTAELYQSKFAVNKAIFDLLQQHNITIPYPQREIKILDGQ